MVARRRRGSDRRATATGRAPAVVLGALVVALVASMGSTPASGASTGRPATRSVDVGTGPPGALISARAVPSRGELPAGARAEELLYLTGPPGGPDRLTSGLVVLPPGPPPPGGYPVVSWAHGTTGVAGTCAPSADGPDEIPYLTALLAAHDVVVATDYPGLGTPGVHPYLEGTSEALSVLDAALATDQLLGGRASNQVVVAGFSQGGQAALFAGQLAPVDTPTLYVAGVVAVAPVTSLLQFAPADPGAGHDAGLGYLVMGLYALSRTGSGMSLDGVLTARGRQDLGVVADRCVGPVLGTFDRVAADRVLRPGWSRGPGLAAAVAANRPGGTFTPAPVLVVQGTDDSLIPYGPTARFVTSRLCRADGDDVELLAVDGASHGSVEAAATDPMVRWIADRLADRPVRAGCLRSSTG